MGDDPSLDELAQRWDSLRRAGRDTTLEELCGDQPETVAEVKERLRAIASLLAFLDLPAGSAAADSESGTTRAPVPGADDPRPESERGEAPGVDPAGGEGQRFRVLRPHARGGLGAVFVALDSELHREVALKQILENHADDPFSRLRFVLEAEITGGLEHPGIVPVYGLGAYSDGRPYYAMRFIKGDSLKDAITRFHDPVGSAVRTDPDVDTIEKVRTADPTGLELRKLLRRFLDVCNTIDYAHARGVLHRDLKPSNVIVGKYGETLVVDWGLAKALGKAEAGPEGEGAERALLPSSASGSAETLPGSVLGTPAYMSPEQAAGDVDHLGPRSDVYSLGAILYDILTGRAPFRGPVGEVLAKVRVGDFPAPRTLDPRIERPLEAICLAAMATKPDDRYPSARSLAEDVERFLADEPVSALPDPLTTRAWRWVRKHRTLTTTAATVALVGLAALGIAYRREAGLNDQLRDANTTLDARNVDLARANTGLVAANRRADRWLDRAMKAIDDYHSGVSEEVLLGRPELQNLRERLLARPKEFYEGLTNDLESGKEATTGGRERLLLAGARLGLGRIEALLGRHDEARRQDDAAVALYRALAAEHPEESAHAAGLGTALSIRGVEEAVRGNPAQAARYQEEATAILEPLWRRRPDDLELGHALAKAQSNLGNEHRAMQRPAAAAAAYTRSIETFRALLAVRPNVPRLRHGLATSLNNLGLGLTDTGRLREAVATLREAQSIRDALAKEFPGSSEYADGQAMTRVNLGRALEDGGDRAGAVDAYRAAAAVWTRLAAAEPGVPDHRYRLALAFTNLGRTFRLLRRSDESLAAYREGIRIREALAAEFPDVTNYQDGLARSYANYAVALQQVDRAADALEPLRLAVAIRTRLAERHPERPGIVVGLADSLNNQGLSLVSLGKTAEAIASYRRGVELVQPIQERSSALVGPRESLSNLYYNLAIALRKADRPAEAIAVVRRRIALWPGDPKELHDAARELARCMPLVPESEPEPREALSREVVAVLAAAEAAGWADLTELEEDELFAPLRRRDDFRAVVSALWRRLDRAFPANPFVR